MRIIGSGKALPELEIYSHQIDKKMGYDLGHTQKVTGIVKRHYANANESAIQFAVTACENALAQSGLTKQDIDCVINASGTMDQAIPYNAAKLHHGLSLSKNTASFDINMTCLSMLQALDLSHSLLNSGRYKNILICSSDIASVGIDWKNIHTGGIFGDGSAALVVTASENKSIVTSNFETHSDHWQLCQIKGGGSLNHPSKIEGDYQDYGQFKMDGKRLFYHSIQILKPFIANLLDKANLTLDDIDWIVPHQASGKALQKFQQGFNIDENKMVNIIETHGNQISASIPTALHELITQRNIKKGDLILMLGTSAGISVGGMIYQW